MTDVQPVGSRHRERMGVLYNILYFNSVLPSGERRSDILIKGLLAFDSRPIIFGNLAAIDDLVTLHCSYSEWMCNTLHSTKCTACTNQSTLLQPTESLCTHLYCLQMLPF